MTNKDRIIRPVLHHYGLTTTRFDEMKNWYAKVIGMVPTFESSDPTGNRAGMNATWVTNDKANHRIGIIAIPGLTDDSEKHLHTKIHHVAYEYSSLDDLLDTYVRLSEIGIEPVISHDHGASIAFYYRDPDQNIVELNTDTFGDWEKSTEFMQKSPQFAAHPNGATIDPKLLVEARELGISSAEIHKRAYAGEYEPSTPADPRALT
ncbi:VOC family protein [Peribacillus aracenensis]|uniref:VOC family protein n=1 Tax=Peribacillus aracenensis TaxID=2976708 RepID=UPI0021A35281|nr:VOC family protein [Peribacillus sp. BBB004]